MEYVAFYFPEYKKSELASMLLYDSKIPVMHNRIPTPIAGLPAGYCTRSIVTKSADYKRVKKILKKSLDSSTYKSYIMNEKTASHCKNELESRMITEFLKRCEAFDWTKFDEKGWNAENKHSPFASIWLYLKRLL